MRYNPPASTRNCRLKVEHCPCGEYHVGVYLTQEVMDNDMLFPEDYGDAKLLAQFDGSAHRECHIGGAGACLYLIASSGLQLIEWGSLALPRCSDNVEAETYGAELALRLMNNMSGSVVSLRSRLSPWTEFRVTSSPLSCIFSSRAAFGGKISSPL